MHGIHYKMFLTYLLHWEKQERHLLMGGQESSNRL